MPRGRRGRPRSNPAGRASPQAPESLVIAEMVCPSPTQHAVSPNLLTDTNSHESQSPHHAPLGNTTEQPTGCAQFLASSPEGPTTAGGASGRSSSSPDPAATDRNADRRSVAQPTPSNVRESHAVDLQLRSPLATTNNIKSTTESGKQLGFSS